MGRLPVPMESCQLQDTTPYVKVFVIPELGLLALDRAQILAIDARVHELGFGDEPPEFLLIVDEVDGRALLLILARFTKHAVVHQLVEVLFEQRFGHLPHLLVYCNVGGHPRALVVLYIPMDHTEDQPML